MAGVFALAQRYVKKASKGAFDTKKRRNIRIVLKTPPGNGGRKPAHADLIQPFFSQALRMRLTVKIVVPI